MNFKNGDLAIIVGGPWSEAIGRVVKIIWKCRAIYGRGVAADGLHYWMTADGPIYLVRPVSGVTLPAGTHGMGGMGGEVKYRLKRRPVCGCHMRPLLRGDIAADTSDGIETPKQRESELEAA